MPCSLLCFEPDDKIQRKKEGDCLSSLPPDSLVIPVSRRECTLKSIKISLVTWEGGFRQVRRELHSRLERLALAKQREWAFGSWLFALSFFAFCCLRTLKLTKYPGAGRTAYILLLVVVALRTSKARSTTDHHYVWNATECIKLQIISSIGILVSRLRLIYFSPGAERLSSPGSVARAKSEKLFSFLIKSSGTPLPSRTSNKSSST